jgi:hypothetical protein
LHTYSSQVIHGYFTLTPIGLDIDPIKTEILEINFQRSNVNLFDISLTGFYKKTKNQIRSAKINPDPGASMSPYLYITSGARSEIKGFEIKIDANLTNNVYIKGDYAFTNAVGNGSDEYSFLHKIDLGENYPNSLYTLDFEHQHNIILNLNYHFDNNEKNRWLRNSGLDFIFELSDGHPFTLSEGWAGSSPYDMGVDYMYDTRGKRALEPLNSSRTEWNHTLNLKLYKEIRLYDQVSINFYCRVLNLLNTKNEINVYEKTGNPDNDGFNTNSIRKIYIQTFGKEYEDLNKAINFENGQAYWDVLGKQLYGHPRQILFGIEISF